MGTHLIDEYKPIDADTNQTNDWNVCFIYPSVENCLAYARKWMRYEIRFSDGQRYSDIDPEAMAAGFHKARVEMHRDPVQRELSNRWLKEKGYSFGEEAMGNGHEPT